MKKQNEFSQKHNSDEIPTPGVYRHFKGAFVRLHQIVKHSETLEHMVVYQHMDDNCDMWVRPLSMWNEIVENADGKKVPRFEYIDIEDYVAKNKSTTIDKVALLYIKDGAVLGARSHNKDILYFPGGKRDEGESDIQCLAREIKEELDVDLDLDSAVHYGTYYAQAHAKPQGTLLKMACYTANFSGAIKPSQEIAEVGWMTYRNRDNGSPIDKMIKDELYQKGLIKY